MLGTPFLIATFSTESCWPPQHLDVPTTLPPLSDPPKSTSKPQHMASCIFRWEERFSKLFIQKFDSFKSLDMCQNLSFTQFKSPSCQKHLTCISSFHIPHVLGLRSLISRPLRHGPGAMSKSKVMEVWMNRFLVDEVDTPWRKGSSNQPRKPDSNTRSFYDSKQHHGRWFITSLTIISPERFTLQFQCVISQATPKSCNAAF